MGTQLYFEDISIGQEIPPLEKYLSPINIVMYLGTVWLTDQIHFDHPYATQKRGLPGTVAPGNMGVDWYGHLLGDWVGEKGELLKLSTQYRNFMVARDTLTCGGKVTNKYVKDGRGYVECELWMKNQRGENCVPGKATAELPRR